MAKSVGSFNYIQQEPILRMDDRFIKVVSDVTRDTWKLTMNPTLLAQQRDEDFINNYKYMDIQTKVIQVDLNGNCKVHLLLQFSIVGHDYNSKHNEMITKFVELCLHDEDEVNAIVIGLGVVGIKNSSYFIFIEARE